MHSRKAEDRHDDKANLGRHAPFDRRLEDGLEVRLRPIVSSDRDRIQSAYGMLSSESRLNRFWEQPDQLGPSLVERLTSVDGVDHVAWIALDPGDGDFPGFGAASFWRDPDDPTCAEIGVTVVDSWQRRGLATLLFSVLWFEGWRLGLRAFRGHSRPENRAILNWWLEQGGEVEERGARQCRMWLPLVDPESFVDRIAFDIRPTYRQIETADWLRDWLRLTA